MLWRGRSNRRRIPGVTPSAPTSTRLVSRRAVELWVVERRRGETVGTRQDIIPGGKGDRRALDPPGDRARRPRRLRVLAGRLEGDRAAGSAASGRRSGGLRPLHPFRHPDAARGAELPLVAPQRVASGRDRTGSEPGGVPVALLSVPAWLRLPDHGLLHNHDPLPQLPGRENGVPPRTGGVAWKLSVPAWKPPRLCPCSGASSR